MVRIRYKKNNETGNFTSKELLAGIHSVSITLNPINNTFSVVNTQNGEVMLQGEDKTFARVKIAAKNALKSLGATFDDEVRNRLPEAEKIAFGSIEHEDFVFEGENEVKAS